MAEEKTKPLVREYVVPLRRAWLKMPEYQRAGRAAKALKKFIAKHMKIPERDVEKVKLDIYLNHVLWMRGARHPPSKIKVRATKEDDIVKVELVEMPQLLKFLKIKHTKLHEKEKPKKEKAKEGEKKPEEKKEEKTEEQKKDEQEKAKSVEQEKIKEAKQEKKIQKHAERGKKVEIHRRAMSRH